MEDYFKRHCCERRFVGPGGDRCTCCNDFFGKGKRGRARRNRAVRRTLKLQDRRILIRARNGALED